MDSLLRGGWGATPCPHEKLFQQTLFTPQMELLQSYQATIRLTIGEEKRRILPFVSLFLLKDFNCTLDRWLNTRRLNNRPPA
jgi:hypothetical protein